MNTTTVRVGGNAVVPGHGSKRMAGVWKVLAIGDLFVTLRKGNITASVPRLLVEGC